MGLETCPACSSTSRLPGAGTGVGTPHGSESVPLSGYGTLTGAGTPQSVIFNASPSSPHSFAREGSWPQAFLGPLKVEAPGDGRHVPETWEEKTSFSWATALSVNKQVFHPSRNLRKKKIGALWKGYCFTHSLRAGLVGAALDQQGEIKSIQAQVWQAA